VLDILRGIAILGILYMNIPYMGSNVASWMGGDMRRLSWSPADQASWAFVHVFWDGTQRGLFEFLFGAGALVLTAKAMRPQDPVAVADLFYRRNLLLIGFGLLDIFLVCWVGDILLIYGLAALLIFPFRKAPPRALFALGLLWAVATAIGWPGSGSGVVGYSERVARIAEVSRIETRQREHQPVSKEETKTLESWREKTASLDLTNPPGKEAQQQIDGEVKAHRAGPFAFMLYSWGVWHKVFAQGNETFFGVLEAVCGMFIGMALFKWGVIQGRKTKRFYALLALGAYAVGCGLRAWGVVELTRFTLEPKVIWITGEFARLAVTLGHVGLFNLIVKTGPGLALLSPFKAAGRMAFSVYVMTSLVMLWFVFAWWGLDLWGKFGWAQLYVLATVVDAIMLVAANLWLRVFACGPLEWTWRSLAYGKRQPFRLATPPAEPLTA
jgi:uncharacterized protein